mgnify:CR=1 FL=1
MIVKCGFDIFGALSILLPLIYPDALLHELVTKFLTQMTGQLSRRLMSEDGNLHVQQDIDTATHAYK